MSEKNPPPTIRHYSVQVHSALKFIENLIVEGLKHGHFDYSITCQIGNGGRRLLVIRAGKSHKFSIMEPDIGDAKDPLDIRSWVIGRMPKPNDQGHGSVRNRP
jgi:hypothetical protein